MTTSAAIVRTLEDGRAWTHRLLDPLDDDALGRQHDPIMSPLLWDLGHIGNYEEIWLLRALGNHDFADDRLDRVYDAFDNPRWTRADLPLLPRDDATEYLADIRAAALRTLRSEGLDPAVPLLREGFAYHLVAQHEAQHQETMLQALNLAAATSSQRLVSTTRSARPRRIDDSERVVIPAGPFAMGTDDHRVYDNERPRHLVDLPAFAIDRYPVTARRYSEFIAAGGYRNPQWWSERGWTWREESGHDAPQGWEPHNGGWRIRHVLYPDQRSGAAIPAAALVHVRPIDPMEPVVHVSYWEAAAFAAWAGGRLPSEAEWEKAATFDPAAPAASRPYPWGNAPPTPQRANLDRHAWGPLPVGSLPASASPLGAEQLLGDCYEWTSSDFQPYPGYRTFPYPEYSEVFFGGDYKVLRGASWASRPTVARATFRNWDHPYRRQIFAGIRVAWEI